MTLPFTQGQFFDVLAAYNRSLWPFIVALWVVSAFACARLMSSSEGSHGRWVSGLLAVHWAWSAIAYHAAFFTRINPAAWLFAVLFLGQAALFLWSGVIKADLSFSSPRTGWNLVGSSLMLYALLYPAITAVAKVVVPVVTARVCSRPALPPPHSPFTFRNIPAPADISARPGIN